MQVKLTPKEINEHGQEVWNFQIVDKISSHGVAKERTTRKTYVRVDDGSEVTWIALYGGRLGQPVTGISKIRFMDRTRERHLEKNVKFEKL